MTKLNSLECRCCGDRNVRQLGKLPVAKVFAGKIGPDALGGGSLYRCTICHFVFRHPVYSKEEYDELYKRGSSTIWDDEDRRDHLLMRDAVTTHLAAGSVLDIGCGAGSLLSLLPSSYARFGVEINAPAANAAAQRGVNVIAGDLSDLARVGREFDAVIACDVIEHVANPIDFVRQMVARTSPGGTVIISTGNASAWSWRLLGGRFWYCYMPEHISFVSPEWFMHHASAIGIELLEVRRFVYSPEFSPFGKAIRLVLMAIFRLSPWLYFKLLPAGKSDYIPVGRGITQDHFMVVLRKKPS